MNRRVALYVWVSTEEQAKNGHSLEQQIGFLKDYCRGRGWKYTRIYQENGVNGSTLDRPKFDLMMFHAERRLFDAIIVYRLDRISRSNLDLQNLVEYLRVLGIELVSATEPFNSTSINGKLLFDLLAGIAEWERGLIRERTRMGARGRARKGLWHGDPPPFGYRYNSVTGRLSIDEKESKDVQTIFTKFLELGEIEPVVRFLKRTGIRTRNGNGWSKATVSRMLSSPLYVGKLVVKDIVTDQPGLRIISEEAFRRVQALKKQVARCHIAQFGRRKGVVHQVIEYCGRCGEELGGTRAYCSNCGEPQWVPKFPSAASSKERARDISRATLLGGR
ncbi:MAG: recombinase family protein [Thermoplasmata archaeon]